MLRQKTRIDDNVGGMTNTTKQSISSQFNGALVVSDSGSATARAETTNGNNIPYTDHRGRLINIDPDCIDIDFLNPVRTKGRE